MLSLLDSRCVLLIKQSPAFNQQRRLLGTKLRNTGEAFFSFGGEDNSKKSKLETNILLCFSKILKANAPGKRHTDAAEAPLKSVTSPSPDYDCIYKSHCFWSSPSRTSAWPAVLYRRCTPYIYCRHSEFFSGVPLAPRATCSSQIQCILLQDCQFLLSYLKSRDTVHIREKAIFQRKYFYLLPLSSIQKTPPESFWTCLNSLMHLPFFIKD